MSEAKYQEARKDESEFAGENDRRKNVRRICEDRRDMIRFDPGKEPRRSGIELRKNNGGGNWQCTGITI